MADPDYSAWLTKQAAADAIGVSTKTLEAMAKRGEVQQAFWRRPAGGAVLAVYHPADVARIATARHPEAAPFVLPADHGAGNGNGNGRAALPARPSTELALPPAPADEALRLLLGAALRAVTSETSQKVPSLFLALDEAAAVSGLSVSYLRRAIAAGELKAVRDRGFKIRRRDLEQL